ncbi:MAG: alpha/beta hydrolase [Firmicutes bacterium]|nr:alpha/beta hydrolase [Bacillota bacterium]
MHKYFEINERGNNIRCKLYYKDKGAPEKAIIFCTGFAGHKDNAAAEKFAEKVLSKYKNIVIIVFDWPAHGDDVKKKLTLGDCDTYLQLVIEHVKNEIGAKQLYAYASSFGAYLVLKYLHEHGDPFVKTALRCPAVSMYDILTGRIMKNDEYDRILKGKDVLVGFDRKVVVTAALLDDLKQNDVREWDYMDYADNMLIIHGTADEVVPYSHSREFAENNVIEFISVEGADHRFQNPQHMSLATKYVMEFFEL